MGNDMFWYLIGCITANGNEKPSYWEPDSQIEEEEFETGEEEEEFETGEEEEEEDRDYCDYIYLLDLRQNSGGIDSYLWEFDPETSDLRELGQLECPFTESNDYLIAMTADQKGLLWFVSNSEYLFKADPSSLSCSATNIPAHDTTLGMHSRSLAFMRMDEESPDILYFGSYFGWNSPEQAVLSYLDGNSVAIAGEIPGVTGYSSCLELAGTTDGRMFAQSLGVGESSHFIELDPGTGDVIENWDLGIESGNAFTFAMLKGEAWLFPSIGPNNHSMIYRFDPDTQEIEFHLELQTTMLGAAAPTCSSDSTGS
jgi:hypothetical protein